MKKVLISLFAFCAFAMVSCGNAEVDKIGQLVVEATTATAAATSPEEVAKIATDLNAEMAKIEAEAGGKLTFGKNVDAVLAEYEKAAKAKLAEFGVEL